MASKDTYIETLKYTNSCLYTKSAQFLRQEKNRFDTFSVYDVQFETNVFQSLGIWDMIHVGKKIDTSQSSSGLKSFRELRLSTLIFRQRNYFPYFTELRIHQPFMHSFKSGKLQVQSQLKSKAFMMRTSEHIHVTDVSFSADDAPAC